MAVAVNVSFAILITGLLVAGVELFSVVSAQLGLVCLGFVLVAGGLVGIYSGNFILGMGIIIGLGMGYFAILRKRVRKWIKLVEET